MALMQGAWRRRLRGSGGAGTMDEMTTAARHPLDPAFPGVDPEVVEAYRSAPRNMVAEILDGALSLMTRPRPRHTKAAARLAHALGGFHDPDDNEPGGWIMLIEPELHLGPRPDGAWRDRSMDGRWA